MGNPKFQDPDVPATKFEFSADDLPALPSDNYIKEIAHFLSRDRLERDGILVANYVRKKLRQWRVVIRNCPETSVSVAGAPNFKSFAEAVVFDYYPDKDETPHVRVEWLDADLFQPELQGGGTYNFEFIMREVPVT